MNPMYTLGGVLLISAVSVAGAQPPSSGSSADALAQYTIVHATDFGKALTRRIPAATTVRSALQSTFPDLARFFGARPNILGAYEDQKDNKSVCVEFSARLNGQQISGVVSARLGDQGATVVVVYCRADAPKAEWIKLIAAPAPAAAAAIAGAAGVSGITGNMRTAETIAAQNRAWERNQLIIARSHADFDETIRGYRTVEDITAGDRTSVDLGDVHRIVEKLNEHDPGRYREVPLRDELYPMPGR